MVAVPRRVLIAVMIFLSTYVNFTYRAHITITTLGMMNPTQKKGGAKAETTCPSMGSSSSKGEIDPNKYNWSAEAEGLIIGGYGYGYCATTVIGGYMAERFGPTITLQVTTLISVIASIAMIPSAFIDWWLIVIWRIIIGMAGGAVYPAVNMLISSWAPPQERSKFTSALVGNALGTFVAQTLVAFLTENLGWIYGVVYVILVGVIYMILGIFFLADSPETSKSITDEEKNYILSSQGGATKKIKSAPPYLKIFKNLAFWAYLICISTNMYCLAMIMLSVPKFMNQILNFDLKKSGALSAMPPLCRLFSGILFGLIGDKVFETGKFTLTCIRKFFIIFSHFLPAVCMILMTVVGCNWLFASLLLIFALLFNGAAVLTVLANGVDIAKNYAGTLFGIASLAGGTGFFVIPMGVGFITREKNTSAEWNIIFLISAGMYIVGGVVFIILGSGEEQDFNKVED